jgi:hypothetical protein
VLLPRKGNTVREGGGKLFCVFNEIYHTSHPGSTIGVEFNAKPEEIRSILVSVKNSHSLPQKEESPIKAHPL